MRFPRIINQQNLTAAVAATLLAGMSPVQVHAAGPASISGNWSGTGTVKLKSGNQERVTCRVKYGRIAGQEFSLNAKCATGSTRVDQLGELKRVSANRYVGEVQNVQFGVQARVTIVVSGQNQSVSITSDQGSASLRLRRR
ncbi:MAG: hypothetical protein AAF732_24115 [Pseudomonadota bacterium]